MWRFNNFKLTKNLAKRSIIFVKEFKIVVKGFKFYLYESGFYWRVEKLQFVDDPKSVDKLFVKIDNDFVIDELGNRIPTIFSKEIERLLENGYKIEGHIAKKIK